MLQVEHDVQVARTCKITEQFIGQSEKPENNRQMPIYY